MNRKIKVFKEVVVEMLMGKVNTFGRDHNIVQISCYESNGFHYCVALYE